MASALTRIRLLRPDHPNRVQTANERKSVKRDTQAQSKPSKIHELLLSESSACSIGTLERRRCGLANGAGTTRRVQSSGNMKTIDLY
jgi:hypothetical protein